METIVHENDTGWTKKVNFHLDQPEWCGYLQDVQHVAIDTLLAFIDISVFGLLFLNFMNIFLAKKTLSL